MNNSIVEELKEEAKKFFIDARPSHYWDHVERVENMCMSIGVIEKCNLYILSIAAYLHDIARHEEDISKGKICHAEKGAVMAREILSRYNIEQFYIDKVAHCIETHRFRNYKEPKTIEAKVLFDSDKLDSIGAIGIGRAFYFANEIKARLHVPDLDLTNSTSYSHDDCAYREYLRKSVHVKDRMLTREGRRIAEGRHNVMVNFFNRLNLEYKGEL